jgi:arylsulfatase A-like enzyme
MRRFAKLRASCAILLALTCITSVAAEEPTKPNILVIFGDDIGWFNISAYGGDLMGVQTPNIDRIAKEGLRLTSFYAQPSCTAGRAAFITGQLPIRTGLTTVGTPGSPAGLQTEDITLAEILKTKGYATAQFGKNHLGDLEEHLPHRHGFDEFFGNLYHLNGNEDLEDPDRPSDPAFRKKFDPRGVISGTADGPTVDDGPLTTKRMETFDAPSSFDPTDRSIMALGDQPLGVSYRAVDRNRICVQSLEARGIDREECNAQNGSNGWLRGHGEGVAQSDC